MQKILMILDNAFKPDLRVQKEINTLTKLGLWVDLICWDQDSDLQNYEKFDSFAIHRIKLKVEKQIGVKKIFYVIKFFFEVKKYLNDANNRYDYIYVHDFLMLPLGIYLRHNFKKKLVYDAHEIYHLMEWEKYPSFISKLIYYFERVLVNKTDFFIVVSEYRKKFYEKKIKKKINVVGNWYDDYTGDSVDLHSKYNIDKSKIIIAYFGVINFKVRPINEIFNFVSKSTNLHLIIGGAGVDQEKIVNMVGNLQNITYLGWLENVREYMDSIDYLIYFMNSDRKYFNYTAPNSLYLAISHSKPLITNVPGEPEDLIRKHNIGFYLNHLNEFSLMKMPSVEQYNIIVNSIGNIKHNYNWSKSTKVYKKIFNL